MKKEVFKLQIKLFSVLGVIGLACTSLFVTSCNKKFPNTLRSEYPNDTALVNYKARKVLFIMLDGVRGSAVKNINPPNITQLTSKSIYSYYALADYKTGNNIVNGTAWANALTGVTSDKHQVVSDDFVGNKLNDFPTLFTRLKVANPNLRTASIAASASFNNNLSADATAKVNATGSNDEERDASVKDAVIDELKRDDAGIIVAQFHNADAVGAANGYTDGTAAYTAAITQLDTYIGNITTALKARSKFQNEDWLVVIASNKGGTIPAAPGDAELGAFADASRNSFIIFYNPRFVTQAIPKPDVNSIPFTGYAPNLVGNNTSRNNLIAPNNTIGSFGTTGDYTLILKVRADHSSIGGYPPFIGKTANFASGNAGWVIFTSGSAWNFKANGTTQFGNPPSGTNRDIRDGVWHTIAIRIYMEGSARYALGYQDGKLVTPRLTVTNVNMTSATPFTVGNIYTSESSPSPINMLIREVAIYNVAIPEVNLLTYMRKTQIESNDVYYNNMLGYWPLTEQSGATLAEKSGKGIDLTYVGSKNFTQFAAVSPNISPTITEEAYSVIMNNVDIPFEIYQWMGVIVPSTWQLNGKAWKPQYIDVRNIN